MRKNINLVCLSIVLILIIAASGCMTSKVKFCQAEELKKEKKYTEAIEYYMKAVRLKPDEARYRLKLMEAMIEASNHFYRLALYHKQEKNLQLALLELNRSLEYNPSNNLAKFEKKTILKMVSSDEKSEEKTWIEKIKDKTSLSNSLSADTDNEKYSFKFM